MRLHAGLRPFSRDMVKPAVGPRPSSQMEPARTGGLNPACARAYCMTQDGVPTCRFGPFRSSVPLQGPEPFG